MRCANCGLDGNSGPRCDRCGVALAARATAAQAPPAPRLARFALPAPQPGWKTELLAIPLALVIALAVVSTRAGLFLVSASAEMELHELGHATALWLAGRSAVPLPMITVSMSAGRSLVAFMVVAIVLGGVGLMAHREGLRVLRGVCVALGAALAVCTPFLDGERLDAWVKFAGAGGELWLGALLMIAFHHRMPARWRWSGARWFFLAWGALTFAAASLRWIHGDIPWGSFWGGDGDMDTLVGYGWSGAQLIRAYRCTLALCLVALASQLAWRARALRRGDG